MSDLDRISILFSHVTDLATALELAQQCERLGFRRLWLAETNGADAAALGGAIVSSTSLEIGTAIVPVYSRTPALLAMTAGTWSALGGGRPVHLGIGAGGQAIIERWHGTDFAAPVATVRDTIAILRQAFAGERSTHQGAQRSSDGFQLALGQQSLARVYVGGMGPRMQQLAAEQADGLIVTWLSPRVLSGFRASFDAKLEAAGRRRADVNLVARAYVAVTDDLDQVRERVRAELVEYLVSPPYARYFASVGFDSEVEAVQAAFDAGDRQGTAAAVSDRLLDEVLVAGRSAAEIRGPLQAYLAAGADDVMVQFVSAARAGDPARTIAAVAEAFA